MNADQIAQAIVSNNLTDRDLNKIIQAVKFARVQLAQQVKRSITIGDNVEFVSNKTNRAMRGFVTKVAIKYVTVNTGQGLWKVPANMLTVITEA